MRYWIRDEDRTPQRFPLKSLFLLIVKLLGPKNFQLWVLRSQGYGAKICKWDDMLDNQDRILVERESLEKLLVGVEEWFYDLDVEIVTEDRLTIRFGLHDSTAMYVDAPEEITDFITGEFKNVQKTKILSP